MSFRKDNKKERVERFFEAGFHNPGMTPAAVGGHEEYLRLVRRYPGQFSNLEVEYANEQEERTEGQA